MLFTSLFSYYNCISFVGVFSEKSVVANFLSICMSEKCLYSNLTEQSLETVTGFQTLDKLPLNSSSRFFLHSVSYGKSDGNLLLIHLWLIWITFLPSHAEDFFFFRVPLLGLLLLAVILNSVFAFVSFLKFISIEYLKYSFILRSSVSLCFRAGYLLSLH